MKTVMAALLLVLAFTTGFTCSKSTPPAETPAAEATPAPTEGAPAEATEAPAGEAAPATENK